MRHLGTSLLIAGLLLLVGCASSGVSETHSTPAAENVRKPDLVLVYDFIGTGAELPPDSVIAQYYEQRTTAQTPEEIDQGRRLGRMVAENLVAELNGAGITAEHASSASKQRVGNGVIRGELVVANEGNRTKRVLIGFGAGSGELKTLVEAFVVTDTGLQPLGSTQVQAGGGKLPGILVPVGVSASATTAAAAGTANVMQERGPESLEAAAKRTATEIAKLVVDAYMQRGWMG